LLPDDITGRGCEIDIHIGAVKFMNHIIHIAPSTQFSGLRPG
jgi:hypothetical protein